MTSTVNWSITIAGSSKQYIAEIINAMKDYAKSIPDKNKSIVMEAILKCVYDRSTLTVEFRDFLATIDNVWFYYTIRDFINKHINTDKDNKDLAYCVVNADTNETTIHQGNNISYNVFPTIPMPNIMPFKEKLENPYLSQECIQPAIKINDIKCERCDRMTSPNKCWFCGNPNPSEGWKKN